MKKIYHNPRCKKSRAGLSYLESKNSDFEVVKYLSQPFTFDHLKKLIGKSDMKPSEVIRKQEDYYKKNLKGKTLSDDELITAMVNNPKLIGRPFVETESKAVLAQPPEEIDKLF